MNIGFWANVFIGCFLFGFVLTLISLLFGFGTHDGGAGGHDGLHVGDGSHDFQLSDVGQDGYHLAGTPAPGDVGHGDASAHGDTGNQAFRSLHLLNYFNYNTVVMFLTWFGAAGYLLLQNGVVTTAVVFGGAISAGLVGSFIVYTFMHKFLMKGQTRMNPSEYYMPGTLARITSSIREGGIGEIVYTQGGTRKTAGARSEDEIPHKTGEEVVIIRYEKGIAYVRSPTYNKHLTSLPQSTTTTKLTD